MNAVLEDGEQISMKFNVADIARPLASVHEINSKGYYCVSGADYGYIQSTTHNHRMPLRVEGQLYFLDMWLQVPKSMTENESFQRHA